MRIISLLAVCFLPFALQGLEVENQLESDTVHVVKVKIQAQEEIGLHRDALPQVVIALKGGTITRLEHDGTTTDVHFPTGVAVYREVDPIDQLHRSVNRGTEAIELIIVELKSSF